jgi:metal-responsive CopG/Arc/MetJ family transcriptional regulator
MTDVTVATKIGSEKLKRIESLVRRRGLLNRSDLVRVAIRLYLNLSSPETETRLRMLRLINESVGVSGKTAAQLVEEARREEDS